MTICNRNFRGQIRVNLPSLPLLVLWASVGFFECDGYRRAPCPASVRSGASCGVSRALPMICHPCTPAALPRSTRAAPRANTNTARSRGSPPAPGRGSPLPVPRFHPRRHLPPPLAHPLPLSAVLLPTELYSNNICSLHLVTSSMTDLFPVDSRFACLLCLSMTMMTELFLIDSR